MSKHRVLTDPHPFSDLHGVSIECATIDNGTQYPNARMYTSKVNPETGERCKPHEIFIVTETTNTCGRTRTVLIAERFSMFSFALDILKKATFDCLSN